MSRPKNKDEYRAELAESFAHVLEEKGLDWKKEWKGSGGNAPHNGITKACYRGCNAFSLSLISMMKGYDDPRWVTMVQIMDKEGKYHPGEKWHLRAGSKATYVEYWFPYDLKEKKALTWEKFKEEVANGRSENEFKLSTRYTAVFNACDIEGMPEILAPDPIDMSADELVTKLSESMGVPITTDGGDSAYYSIASDSIHLPTRESFSNEYAFNATALHELSHSTGHSSRLNRNSTTVIVAIITSKIKRPDDETHVVLPMIKGLPKQSMVEAEQRKTISKSQLLEYRCTLDKETMKRVTSALRASESDDYARNKSNVRMK